MYKLEDLSLELGKSISTIKSNMNELVEAGLIVKKRADTGRVNMIFVKVPDTSVLNDDKSDRKSTHQGTDYKPHKGDKTDFTRGRYLEMMITLFQLWNWKEATCNVLKLCWKRISDIFSGEVLVQVKLT